MKIKLIYFLLLLISFSSAAQEIKQKTEELIRNTFGKKIELEMKKFLIPISFKKTIESEVKQAFFDESLFIYKIKNEKKLVGYAILDNVYGKSMPITFLVIFDPSGNIISSDIIKYREAYGGSVANRRWNDQFTGKNFTSSYEVNKEIDNISGATISVNSVTKGIKKLALLIEKIKDDL